MKIAAEDREEILSIIEEHPEQHFAGFVLRTSYSQIVLYYGGKPQSTKVSNWWTAQLDEAYRFPSRKEAEQACPNSVHLHVAVPVFETTNSLFVHVPEEVITRSSIMLSGNATRH